MQLVSYGFVFYSLILQIAFQYLLISDNLYFNSLQTQLSYERIEYLLNQGKKWQWVGYAVTPVLLLVKLSLITTCLVLGFFFTTNQFNFKAFFNVAVFAELIFLFPILIKLLWFLFVKTDYDLNDLTLFYPLSALNLFDTETLPRYWLAPLQTLNLFEVAYWFLLAYGVGCLGDLVRDDSKTITHQIEQLLENLCYSDALKLLSQRLAQPITTEVEK